MGARNIELGQFLRARRSRLSPRDLGLEPLGRRRVAGLRREELAELAGVSVEYYARLEQGRHATASPAVLESLAQALRLPADQREYLFAIGMGGSAPVSQPSAGDAVPADVRAMLDLFGRTPTLVAGPGCEIVARNDAARFLFKDSPGDPQNFLRWMLTSPRARGLYGDDWAATAETLVANARYCAGISQVRPGTRWDTVIKELTEVSPLFARVWNRHDVQCGGFGDTVLQHSVIGAIRVRNESVTLPSNPTYQFHLLVPVDQRQFDDGFLAGSAVA